jgi:hypothetical protein
MDKIVHFDVEQPEELIAQGRAFAARLDTTLDNWLVERMMADVDEWEKCRRAIP